MGERGGATLLIFSLKALNRNKFDDQFVRMRCQEERGLFDPDNTVVAVRPVVLRGGGAGETGHARTYRQRRVVAFTPPWRGGHLPGRGTKSYPFITPGGFLA